MPKKSQNKKLSKKLSKKVSKKSSKQTKQIRQKRMKYKPDFFINPPKFILIK